MRRRRAEKYRVVGVYTGQTVFLFRSRARYRSMNLQFTHADYLWPAACEPKDLIAAERFGSPSGLSLTSTR